MARPGRSEGRDRRTKSGDFRTRPRASPASLIVLLVSGVLLATAAATALLGGGFDDATPHGRLLGSLQRAAEAQETHHRATGKFAGWRQSLDVQVHEKVELRVLHGTEREWEVMVREPGAGLSCYQKGTWNADGPLREEPVCYRDQI